jgi:hypothetical protein
MFFFRYLWPQLVLAVFVTFFLVALADALDIYHHIITDGHIQRWSMWVFVFYAVALVVALELPGFYVLYVEFRKYRASMKFMATNIGQPLKSHQLFSSVLSDTLADMLLGGAIILFAVTVSMAVDNLERLIEPEWTVCLVFFLLALAVLVAFTSIGIFRTYSQYRLGVNANCFFGAFGCLCCCNQELVDKDKSAMARQNDERSLRNMKTEVAIREAYMERKPYQDNKLVYLLTNQAFFHKAVEQVQVYLLVTAIPVLVWFAVALRARLAHIDWVTPDNTVNEAALAEMTKPPRFVAAGGALWLSDQHVDNLSASLKAWKGSVLPLAIATTPMMVWIVLILLHSLVYLGVYIKNRYSVRDFIEGFAYVQSFVLFMVFLILITVRVDVHVGDQLSWHNTFAPVYALLVIDALCSTLVWILTPAKNKDWRSGESRWGLCI